MIRELQRGDRLTADYIRDRVRAVRRWRLVAGVGLRMTAGTPEGTVISLAAPGPAALREEEHYPYGPKSPFGVRFHGAGVTIFSGIYYHAGVDYEWPDPTPGVQTLTGLTDNQYVCIKIEGPGAGATLTIVAMATRADADGAVIRALCQVTVQNGVARLKKWYGGGIELGVKGSA
jgi:hypothetical protein